MAHSKPAEEDRRIAHARVLDLRSRAILYLSRQRSARRTNHRPDLMSRRQGSGDDGLDIPFFRWTGAPRSATSWPSARKHPSRSRQRPATALPTPPCNDAGSSSESTAAGLLSILEFCTILSSFSVPMTMSMASIPGTGGIMTIREVTDDLTVTERTIYRLAIAKETPSLKVDDSWRFSRANIDTWITEQSTVASPGDADKEI